MRRTALLFIVFTVSCCAQSSLSGCNTQLQSCLSSCPIAGMSSVGAGLAAGSYVAATESIEAYAYWSWLLDVIFFF
jgi:hypothetical protein